MAYEWGEINMADAVVKTVKYFIRKLHQTTWTSCGINLMT